MMRTSLVTCMLVLETAAAIPAQTASQQRIAVIDFQAAVAQTSEFQQRYAEIQKRYDPEREKLAALTNQIDILTKQLQAQGDKLSDTERANRAKTIEDKKKQLQSEGEQDQNAFQKEVATLFQSMAPKVGGVLTDYAQRNGYTSVLQFSQQQTGILYAAASVNITKTIIDIYNADSGAAPSATPPAANQSQAGTPAKIAGVNFQAAVTQTSEFQQELAELQKKYDPERQQLATLNNDIDNLTKQLQTQGDKLSDGERASRNKTIEDKKKQLQREADQDQNAFQKEVEAIFQSLAPKVDGVLADYALKHGYTVILDASQLSPSAVLFAAEPTNITKDLVDITKDLTDGYNSKSTSGTESGVCDQPALQTVSSSDVIDVGYSSGETTIVDDGQFNQLKHGLHYSPACPLLSVGTSASTTLVDGAGRTLAAITVQWLSNTGSQSAPTATFRITLRNMSNCELSPEASLAIPGSAIGADAVGSLLWGQWVALHDPSGGDSDSFQGTTTLNAGYSSLILKTRNPELALSQCRTKGQRFADLAWQTQDVQYNSQNGQAHVRYKESVSIDSGTVTENTDSTVQFIGNTGDYECRGPCTHEDLWTNSMAISDILAVDEGPYVGDDLKSDANDLWVVTLHSKGLGVATQGHAISGCTGTCADANTHSVAISIFFNDERTALAAKQALLAAASGR